MMNSSTTTDRDTTSTGSTSTNKDDKKPDANGDGTKNNSRNNKNKRKKNNTFNQKKMNERDENRRRHPHGQNLTTGEEKEPRRRGRQDRTTPAPKNGECHQHVVVADRENETTNRPNGTTNAFVPNGARPNVGRDTPRHDNCDSSSSQRNRVSRRRRWQQRVNEGREEEEKNGDKKESRKRSEGKKPLYPPYWQASKALHMYHSKDPVLIRGTLRVMPGTRRDKLAFVTCDRGSLAKDVIVRNEIDRNRALDGDTVYVELIPFEEDGDAGLSAGGEGEKEDEEDVVKKMEALGVVDVCGDEEEGDCQSDEEGEELACDEDDEEEDVKVIRKGNSGVSRWRDDEGYARLWNPVLNTEMSKELSLIEQRGNGLEDVKTGRVVLVVPPGGLNQERNRKDGKRESKLIVGTLRRKNLGGKARVFLISNNRSLPAFLTHANFRLPQGVGDGNGNEEENDSTKLFCGEYVYGSWKSHNIWPFCSNLKNLGDSYNPENETIALLTSYGIDFSEFSPAVLRDVDDAVHSGMHLRDNTEGDTDLQWKPSPDMLKGRRDFRSERIFTIDPTTAKDLDDALHVKQLNDGRVEIGVHIADVSHFVMPDSDVDREARERATTVYLVDRTVPMLPRPLCEIACSLNENVERLAFSCVWTMEADGTLKNKTNRSRQSVWFGKSVIRSCARLDYATAQNIIEGTVAKRGQAKAVPDDLWPRSRRPTGGHTMEDVAEDVRLMHRVAMARRKLRFKNGALALNGVKLVFKLNPDESVPELCEPYPIRDSNRLVEEYMLLANYLVAERLLSHEVTKKRAMIRCHPPPQSDGLDAVKNALEHLGFELDATNSRSLCFSINRFEHHCPDRLKVQSVIEMLTVPMNPAEYICAGNNYETEWRHFALNIPYYTHFTSPIRRYADVIVHRLLQETLDNNQNHQYHNDDEANETIPSQKNVILIAKHCNVKRDNAKKAQERSERVFLSLYLRANPITSILGIVTSVGEKTFTVFIPTLGVSQNMFLEEQEHLEWVCLTKKKHLLLTPKNTDDCAWKRINVMVFTKIMVGCYCRSKPPVDVALRMVGPASYND